MTRNSLKVISKHLVGSGTTLSNKNTKLCLLTVTDNFRLLETSSAKKKLYLTLLNVYLLRVASPLILKMFTY